VKFNWYDIKTYPDAIIKDLLTLKINKQRGYAEMAQRENNVNVDITSANNGYLVRTSTSTDIWVYEDIDDAMRQVKSLLEEAFEEEK
jgi:hypothetical protein